MRVPVALTVIAETGERFADFAPYVASINDAGVVAFQAALVGGGTGVFTGAGGALAGDVRSHPDIDGDGALCAYAMLEDGREALVMAEDGQTRVLVATGAELARIGPLGPTMDDAGAIAFRADTAAGHAGVYRWRDGAVTLIADSTRFAGFEGLPVIGPGGTVVFRAELHGGGQGIYAGDGRGELEPLAVTGERFRELGRFPSVNRAGTVAFSATRADGTAGVFTVAGGETRTVVDTGAGFASVRGALVSDAGTIVYYATPPGGQLGIHGRGGLLLAVGDPLLGSTVAEFALNPVSINARDQLAVRVRLADDRQFILRLST